MNVVAPARVTRRDVAAILSRAQSRAFAHHLGRVVGGRRRVPAVLAAAIATLAVAAVLTYGALGMVMGTSVRDAYESARGVAPDLSLVAPEQRDTYLDAVTGLAPVFVGSTVITSAAIALLFAVLMPTTSTLAFAARQVGVARAVIGATAYLTELAWLGVITVALQAGTIAFVATSAPGAAALVGVNVALMALAGSALALTLVHGAWTLGRRLGLGSEMARVGAMVVLAALVICGAIDALRAVVGASSLVMGAVAGQGVVLPDGLHHTATLLGLIAVAGVLGALVSRADPAGGWFGSRGAVVALPPLRHRTVGITLRLCAAMLREPTTMMTVTVGAVFACAVAVGVRMGAVDPGLGMLLLAVFMGSGLEAVGGFALRMRWQFVAAGGSAQWPLWGVTAAAVAAQVTAFVAVAGVAGVLALGAGVVSEGVAVLVCLGALATLAGVVVPFSPSAREGVAVTTLLALALECGVLVALTGWLALTGPALVASSIVIAGVAYVGAGAMLSRRARASF